ncbi:hypothetical protein [Streptomyces sp. TLI_171]|uniref:hypothetical protein n=1 Tax=Streptomyces sp. TLI_171 TaxID=1938859 RepID=UPI0011C3FBED|nr:hypothetical protein [Streptomyces sp. TLI_171]
MFTDRGQQLPLKEREGWRAVEEALAAGAARGVVMRTRSMVASSSEEWERLAVGLGELGWFLAAGLFDGPVAPPVPATSSGQSPLGAQTLNTPGP